MKRRRHTPEQIVRKLREVEPVAGDISIYGQESNYTTWRMARMNLAIRGIEGQIEHGDSFHNDRHPALTGGHAEADQQVRLAGPAVAEQHDGLPPFDPLAAFERCDQRRVDGRRSTVDGRRSTVGAAAKSKSARCLSRGKRASWTRRSRRRASRSSSSAWSSSAR